MYPQTKLRPETKEAERLTYDQVIIGAGSAGCVLAFRLSENPDCRVLLLEAGEGGTSPFINIPKGVSKIRDNPELLWTYPVEQGQQAPGREVWIRGKCLGGTSAINGMIYMRGQPGDFDTWETDNPGWGWRQMSQAFISMERHQLGSSKFRGDRGPLHVSLPRRRAAVAEALIACGVRLGLQRREDINDTDGPRIGVIPHTIRSGRRESAARAFLQPARRRKNLTVVTGAVARRIIFQGSRATGVVCQRRDGSVTEFSGRNLIVAAGVVETPKLLMLSGIGPAEELNRHGISIVRDSPNVGRNLSEHFGIVVRHRMKSGRSYNEALRGHSLWFQIASYVLLRRGLLAEGIYDVGAFAKTRPDIDLPDAQLLMAPISFDVASSPIRLDRAPGMQCLGYVTRPYSRGSIQLRGPDPHEPPLISPNYLADERDRQSSVLLVKYMRRYFSQTPLARYLGEELSPGEDAETDEEILDAFARLGRGCNHGCGTCAMGPLESDVLDHRLNVRGVTGLRVVDASAMPTIPSGNPNGVVMAFAWHAADMIDTSRGNLTCTN